MAIEGGLDGTVGLDPMPARGSIGEVHEPPMREGTLVVLVEGEPETRLIKGYELVEAGGMTVCRAVPWLAGDEMLEWTASGEAVIVRRVDGAG